MVQRKREIHPQPVMLMVLTVQVMESILMQLFVLPSSAPLRYFSIASTRIRQVQHTHSSHAQQVLVRCNESRKRVLFEVLLLSKESAHKGLQKKRRDRGDGAQDSRLAARISRTSYSILNLGIIPFAEQAWIHTGRPGQASKSPPILEDRISHTTTLNSSLIIKTKVRGST